jgi:hypothetical protein
MNTNIDLIKEELKALSGGASLNDLYRLLYYVSQLKYSTADHLRRTHATAFKVATGPKLKRLADLGYINSRFDIYTANKQTYEILKKIKIRKRKIDLDLLPNIPEGHGSINELNNTEVFVEVLSLEDFHALLYPNFGYLRPDGLMVLKLDSRYSLIFLEVEASKSGWDNWLEDKRYNYLKLAKDIAVYEYWQKTAPRLNLPVPSIDSFKFTVSIIGKIKKDWGDGFVFVEP